jgi:hypothetical protein
LHGNSLREFDGYRVRTITLHFTSVRLKVASSVRISLACRLPLTGICKPIIGPKLPRRCELHPTFCSGPHPYSRSRRSTIHPRAIALNVELTPPPG